MGCTRRCTPVQIYVTAFYGHCQIVATGESSEHVTLIRLFVIPHVLRRDKLRLARAFCRLDGDGHGGSTKNDDLEMIETGLQGDCNCSLSLSCYPLLAIDDERIAFSVGASGLAHENRTVSSAFTLQETLYGLIAGIAIAFVIATLMDKFDFVYKAFYPLLVISQTIPTIAIAPLLVLWMGYGMAPRVTLVIITTFFPIAIGLYDGYCSVDGDGVNLLRSMGANKFQIFRHIKLPTAVSSFFSGLRIASSYAVVGALIAEWLGGNNGLGVYMTRVKKAYSFDKMFAVIVFICILSLILMAFVRLIELFAMPYKNEKKEQR